MSTTLRIDLPGPRVRWLGTGALAALLVVACATPALSPRPALAVDPTASTTEHTISVSGTGRVSITPDVADLRIGVQVTRPTVAAARDEAAATMTRVIAALRSAGIADRDIQTVTLSLSPVYDYGSSGSAPRLTGFQISNSVSATQRSIDRVAAAVDGAMAAGATTIDGITFRLDNPAGAESQARIAAMADAKVKADTLATAAGVTVVGVASISEDSSSSPVPIPYAAGAARQSDVSTPIQAGLTDVEVTVSVSYLID